MLFLKQSTASQSVLLGPFVDSTDGDTAETGLSIANTDIRLSKNGGNMAAKNSGGGTHDENGWYTITLDDTDTDTVGRLQVSCKVSGALAVFMEFQVLEEATYDFLYASGATPIADINAECDTALSDYDAVVPADLPSNFGDLSITSTTGRVDVASIEGSDATDQINAACDTAIETYGLDHLVSASVAGTDVADDSIIAQLVSASATADWDDFDNTSDSLQALSDALVTIDDFIDTEIGTLLTETQTNIPADIAALNDLSAAEVNTEVDTALGTTTYGEPTGVPGATVTLATKIGYLYMALRNKVTVTSSKMQFYDDSDNAEWEKDLTDDGTTYTESESNAI